MLFPIKNREDLEELEDPSFKKIKLKNCDYEIN